MVGADGVHIGGNSFDAGGVTVEEGDVILRRVDRPGDAGRGG